MGESAPLITLCGVVLGPLTAAGMLYYVVVVGQGIGAGAQRPDCSLSMPTNSPSASNPLIGWDDTSAAVAVGVD